MKYNSRRVQSTIGLWFRTRLTWRNLGTLLIPLILILMLAPLAIGLILQSIYSPRIFGDLAKITSTKVALIPALAELPDNTNHNVSDVVALFKANKIQKVLLSGDAADILTQLKNLLVREGIPSSNIFTDSQTKRAYDVCYRAKNIYSLNEIIIVSDALSLPRMLFICSSLGVSATAFHTTTDDIGLSFSAQLKQLISLAQAVIDVDIAPPTDVVRGDKVVL